ncbi:MAG: type II CAAX prenyl endopeptidase Rce1 family protein, partial [Candidatus Zixiibacteriota bacterium]
MLLFYPGISLGFNENPSALLKGLNEGTRIVLLVSTIVMQWSLFSLIYLAVFREGTSLLGIGLRRFRWIDAGWALAFLLGSNLILSGAAWLLGQIGLPMMGEVGLLVPEELFGKILWVGVSFTAGFCEEIMFRGYLMTRLRLVGRLPNWLWPTVISAVAFGVCHSYQGWPGLIIITIYGVLFSLLYIRTGS